MENISLYIHPHFWGSGGPLSRLSVAVLFLNYLGSAAASPPPFGQSGRGGVANWSSRPPGSVIQRQKNTRQKRNVHFLGNSGLVVRYIPLILPHPLPVWFADVYGIWMEARISSDYSDDILANCVIIYQMFWPTAARAAKFILRGKNGSLIWPGRWHDVLR